MAYQARLSAYVRGGVTDSSYQEGIPVIVSQSGNRSGSELPTLTAAPTGHVHDVFILFKGPDDFARPTDSRMYTVGYLSQTDPSSGYADPIHTATLYNVGKSTLWNPTITSGELANAHRGGTYAVPSGTFVDGAAIRVPGALVKVGAGNKWDVTTDNSVAVGMVEEYNTVNGVLIFSLWH